MNKKIKKQDFDNKLYISVIKFKLTFVLGILNMIFDGKNLPFDTSLKWSFKELQWLKLSGLLQTLNRRFKQLYNFPIFLLVKVSLDNREFFNQNFWSKKTFFLYQLSYTYIALFYSHSPIHPHTNRFPQ